MVGHHWDAIENNYYTEEVTMKTIVLFGCVLIVFLAPFAGTAQTTAPTISDLKISGIEGVKPGEPYVISYNFSSNQKPEEVIVDSFFAGPYFSRRSVYSSKKGELRVAVTEKEGVYEIAASRDASGPPAIAGGSSLEVEVWIKSGGTNSNKLKTIIPINY